MNKVNEFLNATGDLDALKSELSKIEAERDKQKSILDRYAKDLSEAQSVLNNTRRSSFSYSQVKAKYYMANQKFLAQKKIVDELNKRVDVAKKAVEAYADSPVHEKEVALDEAKKVIEETKEEVKTTVAKYEQKLSKYQKYLLLGLGLVVVSFVGYKLIKK